MRKFVQAAFGAACCIAAITPAQAVQFAPAMPVVTLNYMIDARPGGLQFMSDGSVRPIFPSDGSVLPSDGSVMPGDELGYVIPDGELISTVVTGATVQFDNAGFARLGSPLFLLSDGSVRVMSDGSVMPTIDYIVLSGFNARANPFLSATIQVVDIGEPSTFTANLSLPLALGVNAYTYDLSGQAKLEDLSGDGTVTMTPGTLLGGTGLVVGGVDGMSVAALGASGLIGAGDWPLLPGASGAGTCVACASQFVGFAFTGSGHGDRYTITGTFDVTPVPEPGPLGLLAAGLIGLAFARRHFGPAGSRAPA